MQKKGSMKELTMPQAFLALLNFYLLHMRNLLGIQHFLSNIDSCDLPSIWLLSTSASLVRVPNIHNLCLFAAQCCSKQPLTHIVVSCSFKI